MTTTSAPTLTPEQIASYHETGFLVAKGLIPADEMAALTAEAAKIFQRADLIDSDNIRCRWQNHFETGECRFDCFDPVIDLGPVCARVARHPAIIDAVSALYGEPACLFKDKLIFKPPGAKGYALHQDYISWESFPKSFVTVIVAIDPAGANNGATEVFAGFHKRGCLTPMDGMYQELPAETVAGTPGVMLELNPGDIAIFSGFTPHRSAPNRSGEFRRLLYLSYNARSEGGDQREKHYAEFKSWLMDRYAEYGKTNVFFR
ncbi:MAG TPA: phytanoyl-CoA dioxygenase family protein [Verrucomicrobiae bacterium]|nr:phytanoyl-CoA dioxygenase family protein [Verrucomicrobiae bacterium]